MYFFTLLTHHFTAYFFIAFTVMLIFFGSIIIKNIKRHEIMLYLDTPIYYFTYTYVTLGAIGCKK